MTEQDPINATPVSDIEQAKSFYVATYEPLYIGSSVRTKPRVWIGSNRFPRHCRFCLKQEPNVSFTQDAHALPALTGNRQLFSHEECDSCNAKFGILENDLGNFTLPERSMEYVKGRQGIPTVKTKDWRINATDTGLHVHTSANSKPWVEDEEKKLLHFRIKIPRYRPLAVYKAFLKMALSVMPVAELEYFHQALRWLASDGIDENLAIDGTGFICYRTVGPRRFEDPLVILLRRKQQANAPYASFFVTFGNSSYQIFLPSPEKDDYLVDQDIYLPAWPTPDMRNPLPGNNMPRMEKISLESPALSGGTEWTRTLSYQEKKKTS